MQDEKTASFDPEKVKQTKTYSISLADVARVKEMGEFVGVSDAEVLHRAIAKLYGELFPVSVE